MLKLPLEAMGCPNSNAFAVGLSVTCSLVSVGEAASRSKTSSTMLYQSPIQCESIIHSFY